MQIKFFFGKNWKLTIVFAKSVSFPVFVFFFEAIKFFCILYSLTADIFLYVHLSPCSFS